MSMPGTFSYYISSAGVSATSSQQSRGSQRQSEMKGNIENELSNATYYVDLISHTGDESAILQVDPIIAGTVINTLETTFQALTSEGDSSPSNPRFPLRGFPTEPPSYRPLAHLLNKIIDTASQHLRRRSQLTGLHVHPFGRTVEDIYGSHKRLKPDGVGILGKFFDQNGGHTEEPSKAVLKWKQIEVVVESKATIADMVRQSGTYARSCLLSNHRRFFSLGIGFHYKKLEAYVFAFHHCGLSSSRPLSLTTREGFNGLVRHIVAILSFKDEAAYGLDPTRTQDIFLINNRHYEIVRTLYVRGSLRGRSTVVYSLQVTENIPQLEHALESRMLTLSGSNRLPDTITYKQTYQIKGHSQEGPLFSQFCGQFGIADIIGYHECGREDPHGSTNRLLNKAEYWDVFGKQDHSDNRGHEPEDRGLQCIALSGEGKALIDLGNTDGGTPSPGELLESILHAIIGHYNLFDKGILHRDISSGNVLRYSEPVLRPALDKFECTRNVDLCRGFLIDGDLAIKWRELSTSQSISGTMPFMSMRLLRSWQAQKTTIHTALDDIESFLWLLIWVIVHASKDIHRAKATNPGIQLMLDAWSGDVNGNRTKLDTAQNDWEDVVFGDLIREWLSIFQKAHDENKQLIKGMSTMRLGSQEWEKTCDELESYCKDIYQKVLESGFGYLEGVRKYSDWNEVVTANVEKFGTKRGYGDVE